MIALSILENRQYYSELAFNYSLYEDSTTVHILAYSARIKITLD